MDSKMIQLNPTTNPNEFSTDIIKLNNSGFQEICAEHDNCQICDMKSIFHIGKLFFA